MNCGIMVRAKMDSLIIKSGIMVSGKKCSGIIDVSYNAKQYDGQWHNGQW